MSFKGKVQRDFRHPIFSSFEVWTHLAPDQRVKIEYLKFCLWFWRFIQILIFKKILTPRGIKPQGDWLARFSDSGEIDSPGSQTLRRLTRQVLRLWGKLTRQALRLWGDWLARFSHSGEIYLPGSQSLGRLTRQGLRLWGEWLARVSDSRRLIRQGLRLWGDWPVRFSDSREIDSPGSQTLGILTRQVFRL